MDPLLLKLQSILSGATAGAFAPDNRPNVPPPAEPLPDSAFTGDDDAPAAVEVVPEQDADDAAVRAAIDALRAAGAAGTPATLVLDPATGGLVVGPALPPPAAPEPAQPPLPLPAVVGPAAPRRSGRAPFRPGRRFERRDVAVAYRKVDRVTVEPSHAMNEAVMAVWFPGVPAAATRDALKAQGWKFNLYGDGAWTNVHTPRNFQWATALAAAWASAASAGVPTTAA